MEGREKDIWKERGMDTDSTMRLCREKVMICLYGGVGEWRSG